MKSYLAALLGVGMAMPTLLFLLAGCQKTATLADTSAAATEPTLAATSPSAGADADFSAAAPRKGGAQVWSENCMRCHNLRQPRERSDREWEVIAHHMRVRANLTAEEHRLILAFLCAAN